MKKLLPHAVLLLLCLLAFCACGKCEVCTFGDWTTVTSATCTQPGTETRVCAECEFVEEREIPQLAHDMVFAETKTAATCTEKGADLYKCKNCDHTETRFVTALGHKYGEWSEKTASTCTATGTKERTCSVCGESESKAIPAKGHSFGEWKIAKAATCTASGTKQKTCSVCGHAQTQTLAATGHHYGNWYTSTSATCTSNGTQKQTCSGCGDTKTKTVASTGHSWKDATCTSAKKCSRCGTTSGSALGHNYSSGECTRCGTKVSATIQLPATPVELSYYWNNKRQTTHKINSITMEYDDYYSKTGRMSYTITFTGECTYNYKGSGQSTSMLIGYKLYDSDDVVVDSNTTYTESVAMGEKYKETITVYVNPGETYRLVILDSN